MAEHVWTVLCRQVLFDSDGVISLVNVTDKLVIPDEIKQELVKARQEDLKGVFVHLRLHLISWWTRSDLSKPEMLDGRVSIMNPSGEIVNQQAVTADLKEFLGHRIDLGFEEFPITGLGPHHFRIEQKRKSKGNRTQWKIEAKIPLLIV